MKKLIIFLLAITLCFSLFAGCSASGSNTESTRTITDGANRQVTSPETVKSIVCVGVGALRYTCYMGAQDLVVAVEDCEKEAVISRLYNFVNIEKFRDLPVIGTNGNPYLVNVTMMNGKKRKFILHATSVAMANEIMKDYGELELGDGFQISSIQEAEKFMVIEDNLRTMNEVENGETGAELETDNEDFEPKFYKIDTKCEVLVNEEAVNEFESSFLVFAQDAEQGKELIGRFMDDYLAKDKKEGDPDKTCQLTILAAAVYQCNKIISRQFCKAYIDQDDWACPAHQMDASNSENGHVQWHRNTPEDLPESDDKQLLIVMKGGDQVMFGSTIDGKLLPDVEFWSYVDTTDIERMRAERSDDETE